MKLRIEKRIEAGTFIVEVEAVAFTLEEQEQMEKFGSPSISIVPKRYFNGNAFVHAMPVHALNNTFSFESEEAASDFAKQMHERIVGAMQQLRQRKDDFSTSLEYEI